MTERVNAMFPWKDFALWLREGVIAARIVNKFMMTSWRDESRDAGQSPPIERLATEEKDFLRIVKRLIYTEDSATRDMVTRLEKNGTYFAISAEQAQALWTACMKYGMSSERSGTIKHALKTLIQTHQNDLEAPATAFMDHVWRTLGPATTPDRSVIEKAHNQKISS